jgi:hypothetical protein
MGDKSPRSKDKKQGKSKKVKAQTKRDKKQQRLVPDAKKA